MAFRRYLPTILFFFFTTWLPLSTTSNILFFMGRGSHSHRVALEPLAHKLTEEGHNVTILSPMTPTKLNPLIHEFAPKELVQFYNDVITTFPNKYIPGRLADKYRNDAPNPRLINDLDFIACNLIFNSPEFKPWLESVQFDLVILDLVGNKCAYGLAYKFNAPTIVHSAVGALSHEEDMFGLPTSDMSWLPNYASTNVFTQERSLYDKIYVTLYRIYSHLYTNYVALPNMDLLVRTVLEMPDMPSIVELEKNTSLFFFNQHFSNDYARSLPPHAIQTAGMHCESYQFKGLPKNVQDFIDGAGSDGFVFMSFGTIFGMSRIPTDLVNSLFDAVRNTKTRFLWKWDGEPPANLPSNVMTAPWFSQLDVLASKSIRAFVTHGGQNSLQEAVCMGVPVIVVPVACDQPYNAQTTEFHEYGIHLELSEMREKFQESLNSILNDKKYKRNAKLVSQRFKDRPMSAVETASFWTNYVLRNKDVSYMRPMGYLRLSWWERRLMDVWATLFTGLLVLILVVVKIIKAFWMLCTRVYSKNKLKRS